MRKILLYLIFPCLLVLMFSCEYYLGFDQQPKFRNETIEEGLNIFGILRPDSLESFNRSFVYVHRVMPVMEPENFFILHDAVVKIEKIIGENNSEIIEFPLVPPNMVFPDTAYRPLSGFSPMAGERYRISCMLNGFPEATGETTIPSIPEIVPNTLTVNDRTVSFTLAPDSLTGMIDIYHVTDYFYLPLTRLIPSVGMGTEVVLTLPVAPAGTRFIIYAYDQNMAVYIGNSNISLNFNKFRKTFSTLESGFGVFGGMNYCEVELGGR